MTDRQQHLGTHLLDSRMSAADTVYTLGLKTFRQRTNTRHLSDLTFLVDGGYALLHDSRRSTMIRPLSSGEIVITQTDAEDQ